MKLTTAFEARRRIVTLLTTAPDLTGVKVTRGGPTRAIEADTEMVYFGPGLSDSDAELPAIGGERRDDEYVLPLNVYVFRRGDDEQGTEQRCEALCDAVITALFTDLQLGAADAGQNHPGGLLKQAVEVTRWELQTDPVGEPPGWRSTATLELRCQSFMLRN